MSNLVSGAVYFVQESGFTANKPPMVGNSIHDVLECTETETPG